MNILVIDVAATESGALTILKQYYDDLLLDKENHYYFCVSKPKFENTDNITILSFPWSKKSWFHRLWFDYITCKKIIKQYRIDTILSLQNTIVPNVNIPQTVYLHQPLPFVSYKYSFREDKKMWCYQNIISRFISSSLKKADKVIVQTQWMKDAVQKKEGILEYKITLQPPKITVEIKRRFDPKTWNGDYFYPASNFNYKNHYIILKAMMLLKEKGKTVPNVLFTLTQEQLPKNCIELYRQLKEHIVLLGSISHDKVLDLYSKTALIFPSYIETFGLPLLEARMVGAPVIASDCPFCNEILDQYDKADFFDPFQANQLAQKIEKLSEGNANAIN